MPGLSELRAAIAGGQLPEALGEVRLTLEPNSSCAWHSRGCSNSEAARGSGLGRVARPRLIRVSDTEQLCERCSPGPQFLHNNAVGRGFLLTHALDLLELWESVSGEEPAREEDAKEWERHALYCISRSEMILAETARSPGVAREWELVLGGWAQEIQRELIGVEGTPESLLARIAPEAGSSEEEFASWEAVSAEIMGSPWQQLNDELLLMATSLPGAGGIRVAHLPRWALEQLEGRGVLVGESSGHQERWRPDPELLGLIAALYAPFDENALGSLRAATATARACLAGARVR